MLPLIEDLPNPVERDTYRQRLARFLKVDERSISGEARQRPETRRARPGPQPRPRQSRRPTCRSARCTSPSHRSEAHILGLLHPPADLLYRLDRGSGGSRSGPPGSRGFRVYRPPGLLRLIRQSLEQDDHDAGRLPAPKTCRPRLKAWWMNWPQTGRARPLDDRLIEDLFRTV